MVSVLPRPGHLHPVTQVDNFSSDFNVDGFLKEFKQTYSCNGTIVIEGPDCVEKVLLHGDQRSNLETFSRNRDDIVLYSS